MQGHDNIFNPTDNEIKQIEKVFSADFVGKSRIDGYPMFKVKKEYVTEMKEVFSMDFISVLEDHIAGFNTLSAATYTTPSLPAGQRDFLMLKITGAKDKFNQYLRKEKLKKIEINF